MKRNTIICFSCVAVLLLLLLIILNFNINISDSGKNTVEYGSNYSKLALDVKLQGNILFKKGFKVSDKYINTENELDVNKLGAQIIKYNVNYVFWNAHHEKLITVVDTTKPVITLTGDASVEIPVGSKFEEPGFSAHDNYDGDLTGKVTVTSEENIITYTVKDSSGNLASVVRTINYIGGDGPTNTPSLDPSNTPTPVPTDVPSPTATVAPTATKAPTATTAPTATPEPTKDPEGATSNGKTIYLTFDDGPCKYTPRLLEILDKYEDVKVTFFVVNHPDEYNKYIKEAYDRGHSIGIHSYTHVYGTIYKSVDAYLDDFYKMQEVVKKQIGHEAEIFRFPGGSSNEISMSYCKGIMTELTSLMREKGYEYFDWNVTSGDAGGTESTEQVFKNIKAGCSGKGPNFVVLQHDIKDYSIEAVEEVIKWGLANGYTFKALDKDSPACKHTVHN